MAEAPLLEFREVRKHYASGGEPVRAVDGLSLTIAAGELVALYGPSGSGNSTLLRVAAGIEPLDSGEVLVAGVDVTRLSAKDAARYRMYTLGWVHQEAGLDEGATVLENAAIKHLVATKSVREGFRKVTPLLHELGLGHRLNHLRQRQHQRRVALVLQQHVAERGIVRCQRASVVKTGLGPHLEREAVAVFGDDHCLCQKSVG